MPLAEFFGHSAPKTQNTIKNPRKQSSPHFITYQHKNQMASPIPQGEFSSAGSFQSSPNTTTLDHDDSSWPISIRKGT